MDAVSASGAEGLSRGALNEDMQKIETELRRRLPIGWTTSYQALVKEFVTGQGYSQHALDRILYALERREVIRYSNQKKVVHRWVLSYVKCPAAHISDQTILYYSELAYSVVVYLNSAGRVVCVLYVSVHLPLFCCNCKLAYIMWLERPGPPPDQETPRQDSA